MCYRSRQCTTSRHSFSLSFKGPLVYPELRGAALHGFRQGAEANSEAGAVNAREHAVSQRISRHSPLVTHHCIWETSLFHQPPRDATQKTTAATWRANFAC